MDERTGEMIKPIFNTPEEYLHAAYSDAMIEGLPIEIVISAYTETRGNAEKFFFAVQAAVMLKDLIEDRRAAV